MPWRKLPGGPVDSPPYADYLLGLGPAAYYRLGEVAGAAADDATGRYPGSFVGAAQRGIPGPLRGDADAATGFPGSPAYLDLPHAALLRGVAAATLCFWMRYRPTAVIADGGVLYRDGQLQLWIDADGFLTQRKRTLTVNIFSNQAGVSNARIEGGTDMVRPGIWDFFAVTFVGNDSLKLYRNGVLDRQEAVGFSSLVDVGGGLNFGRIPGGIGHAPADFDELAFFHHALPPAELLRLYQLGRGRLQSPAAG